MALPGVNPTIRYLDDGAPDGTTLGQSATTSKISFYAATPVVQPTSANQAAVATAAVVSTAGIYGFTFAQGNGIIILLNQIRSDLVTVGIIKGS